MNPRYESYSKANGKTPEEMLSADAIKYPGGKMTGFIVWINEKFREFKAESPEYFHGDNLLDQDAFTGWLEINSDEFIDLSEFADECGENGGHEYAEKACPKCGRVFCYSCCSGQNVDQGGKHEPDFMACPGCGHDYYGEVSV